MDGERATSRGRWHALAWFFAALLAGLGATSTGARQTPVGDAWLYPPPVTSPNWFRWYDDTLAARLTLSPRERPRTVHFASSGDDVSGDGSAASPYRTLAKAQAVHDEDLDGDVALLFRRGDVWRADVGLTLVNPNITVADYGVGPKPVFTPFRPVAPGLWQPDPSRPGVFVLDESATYLAGLSKDIVWVKQDEDRERPLARMSSADLVGQRPGTWHWDHVTGRLYLHPKWVGGAPVDPRVSAPFEVTRPTLSGVFVRGHGSRVENIVAEGWGLSRTVYATQKSGIEVGASQAEYVAVIGCESYYNPSHAIAHWAFGGTGGVVTFVGCRAGLCNFNGVGTETIFNTFANTGTQSVIFDSCEAAYGTLPSSEWDYVNVRRGRGFYGHTLSSQLYANMIVMKDCLTRGDNPSGCGDPSHFNSIPPAFNLAEARCWVVNETFLAGPGCEGLVATIGDAVRVNGRYMNVRPPPGGAGALQNWAITGWAINCVYDIDARDRTARYAISNNPGFSVLGSPKFWNCTFRIRTSMSGGLAFSFEYDMPDQVTGAQLFNCVVMHEGPGVCQIGLGDERAALSANAYFGVDPSSYNLDRHLITLPGPVPLLAPPPLGSPIMVSRRPQAMIEAIDVGFDLSGRAMRRTDRGAIDWASVIGDLNADGRLNVDDLYRWYEVPVDLTGDTAANAADSGWLERAIRFDEVHDMRERRRPKPVDPPAPSVTAPNPPPNGPG